MSEKKLARRKSRHPRHPGGRLKVEPHLAVAEIKRVRDVLINAARNPELGTICGRLFFYGKITAEQYEAGKRWDKAVEAMRTAGEVDDFEGAHSVLRSAGPLVYSVVQKTIEEDQYPVGEEGMIALKLGLNLLAQHWGLTLRAKNASPVNRQSRDLRPSPKKPDPPHPPPRSRPKEWW
jgi:hypothetical protein